MFASQVLETAVGIAFLLFILATAASALLELGRRLLNSRSKDLEVALQSFFLDKQDAPSTPARFGSALLRMIGFVGGPRLGAGAREAWEGFTSTSVYVGAKAARNQVRPAYLSARAFAEAVEEQVRNGTMPTGALKQRVTALMTSAGNDAAKLRAGLESWFDEAMAGLSSRYQKRSTVWLFVFGFILAGSLNASVPRVSEQLWTDSATRAAVVAAAGGYRTPSSGSSAQSDAGTTIDQVAGAADQLQELHLPIGWSPELTPHDGPHLVVLILGWLLTALLISLGAPFWYDLLGRLTATQSPKPASASGDENSASAKVAKSENLGLDAWPPMPGDAGYQQPDAKQADAIEEKGQGDARATN